MKATIALASLALLLGCGGSSSSAPPDARTILWELQGITNLLSAPREIFELDTMRFGADSGVELLFYTDPIFTADFKTPRTLVDTYLSAGFDEVLVFLTRRERYVEAFAEATSGLDLYEEHWIFETVQLTSEEAVVDGFVEFHVNGLVVDLWGGEMLFHPR